MAERSTAPVGVAKNGGGNSSRSGKTDQVAPDGETAESRGQDDTTPAAEQTDTPPPEAPDLHSGHKLARRYRLEECVTRLGGFSSWRAVDEKLRRAVGVHVLSTEHPHARSVLASARSAALLGDPRFVQVLDAVDGDDLAYVVHEWLPDAIPLHTLLATGPLSAHEAYRLVDQLAQALTAAHREGLAHLRISPTSVLRTGAGQYRMRGLAVGAALRGVTSEQPQRADTEAIGAVLYAALTGRWPYEDDAYGLSGIGALAGGTLIAPDQVRAGVHRGLSELAMRAMVNDGATASREEQPCTTPEELVAAVAALPRIRPPEPHFTALPGHDPTTAHRGPYARPSASPAEGKPSDGPAVGPAARSAPPALPGRTGAALKWSVAALLFVALGLGSWQVSDTLMNGDAPTDNTAGQADEAPTGEGKSTAKPLPIVEATDFDPFGNGSENPEKTAAAHDGDPATAWHTMKYFGRPDLGNLKPGVGLILDLGKKRSVQGVTVNFAGRTSARLLFAPEDADTRPTSYDAFEQVAKDTGRTLNYQSEKPVTTQYVLVWLTELPRAGDGNYRGRITEVQVSG